MTDRELRYWQVLHSIEPFGESREDWRNALLAHAVIAGYGGKDTPNVKDLVITFDAEDAGRKRAERLERKLSTYIKARNAENVNGKQDKRRISGSERNA